MSRALCSLLRRQFSGRFSSRVFHHPPCYSKSSIYSKSPPIGRIVEVGLQLSSPRYLTFKRHRVLGESCCEIHQTYNPCMLPALLQDVGWFAGCRRETVRVSSRAVHQFNRRDHAVSHPSQTTDRPTDQPPNANLIDSLKAF